MEKSHHARPSCIVSLLFSSFALSVANAFAQAPVIDHQEVGCVVAEKFPLFSARFDPAESVARARVHFRAEGGPLWYYVEMKPRGDAFYGTLPKPRKTTKKIQYYIEVVDKAFAESRTPEFAPDVMEGAAACDMKKALAGAAKAASVVVGGPAGAPLIPAGFAPSGIAAAGAAAGVAAGAAAGVSTAVIVAGVVGGGAAVAGVAVAAGGRGEMPTTTTTTTTLPPSLTGSWVGTAPDGIILTTNIECETESDLSLDLTQTGPGLGGTLTLVVRKLNPGPPPPPNSCSDPVGTVRGPFPLSGTVGAGSVSFTATFPQPENPRTPGALTVNFMGTFTAVRMSGAFACVANCPQAGTWAVNRR